MPLSAGGKLTIKASADLGALGSRQGPPIIYDWELLGVAPVLWPWLIILSLLSLKPNRCPSAWLILLPVTFVILITEVPPTMLPDGSGFLLDVVAALATGLAAVWLISNYLRQQHRLLTFLCILGALGGVSLFTSVARQGWDQMTSDWFQVGMVLGVAVLASSSALSLAGLICRARFHPLVLNAWLLLLLSAVWLLVTLPFLLIAVLASGSEIGWGGCIFSVLKISLVNFVTLQPFLILSSVSPLFRERLKSLLHIKSEVTPAVSHWEEALSKA